MFSGIINILGMFSSLIDFFIKKQQKEEIKREVKQEIQNDELQKTVEFLEESKATPSDKQSVLDRLRREDSA